MSNPVVTNVDGTNAGPNVTTSPAPYLYQGTPAQIGVAATSLVAFYGATPVVQAAALVAVGTSVPVAACATFGLTSTQLTALVTATNSIITALHNLGITA